jgi:DNA-directed RNA polymerase specialized sigma24 family protein
MVGAGAADDVLQEISLRIYRQIEWLREPKVFRAWAYRGLIVLLRGWPSRT